MKCSVADLQCLLKIYCQIKKIELGCQRLKEICNQNRISDKAIASNKKNKPSSLFSKLKFTPNSEKPLYFSIPLFIYYFVFHLPSFIYLLTWILSWR